MNTRRHYTKPPIGGAATTSSQIYLSRGVAGTKSEPALPVLSLEPLQITSLFESRHVHRLSLNSTQPPPEQMHHTSESSLANLPLVQANQGQLTEQSRSPSRNNQTAPVKKRSEVLRHVFPRSSRRLMSCNRASAPRVSKADHYRSAFLYRHQLKPRGTFHRVISSFFGNTSGGAHSVRSLDRSHASSFGSRPESSIYGSVPSLDLVSPGAFLFSGPSLRSAGSFQNSSSRLPSLTESVDDAYIFRRVLSESLSMVDNCSVKDEMLEPIVGQGVVRSMSDVLLGINTPIEEMGDPLLGGCENECGLRDHRSTRSGAPSYRACLGDSHLRNDLSQNLVVATLILRYLDVATSRNLRLTNRSWYNAVSSVVPIIPPASVQLPTEILLNIYNYLGARDFNAARRISRGWMLASLDKSLLMTMLGRGGWHSDSRIGENGSSILYGNEAWCLSQHLSRQCALASRWTGNGLDIRPAVVENTEIDFSDLAHGHALQRGRASGGLIFTSSICGKYLLVAKDTLIYIYGLEDGLVRPLTSVVCPRRVLAMSMNASVGRDAVAALLEGRMGMVCELRYGSPAPASASGDQCVEGDGYPPRPSVRPSMTTGETSDLQDAIDSAEHTSPRVLRSFPCAQNPDLDSFSAIELKTVNQRFSLRGTDDHSSHDRNLIAQTWNLSLRGPLKNLRVNSKATLPVQNIPIESGTSTFYRHLCSEDDPPRNVSICPQRRCVAFGCSAGIELHWIDALTGQSLSRWFPLTSPSDHLYFLSPRPGFESAKKLRLISSAAHPHDRPAISRRLFSSPTTSSFWGSFGFESRTRLTQSRDHYHAVPLSDGHHVLFIDPSNERLTLGCDAPLGGPSKLLRKVVLTPPEDKVVPRIYTAAADMSSGARIVVVYNETVLLYSIPPDVLHLSRLEQAAESWDVYNAPPFSPAGRHHDHWLNWWDEPTALDAANRLQMDSDSPVWPISISGTEISRLSGICELAIQTLPDILIWAFTYTCQCKTWRMHNYVDPITRSRQYIDRSGLVHESYSVDEIRDVIMHDAPPSSVASSAINLHVDGEEWENPQAERSIIVGFDGNASGVLKRIPKALAVENDDWVDNIDVVGCTDAWFEGGGDVVTWHQV